LGGKKKTSFTGTQEKGAMTLQEPYMVKMWCFILKTFPWEVTEGEKHGSDMIHLPF